MSREENFKPGEHASRPARGSGDRGARRTDDRRADDRRTGGRPGWRPADGAERPKQSLSEEIIGLDEEILRVLARRSALMVKLRKGKSHAATPAVIKSEKQIRNAWEEQTTRLGGGTRLSRQLFALIQDLNIVAVHNESYSPFNLSPARQPVEIDSPGPTSALVAQLWLALAASCGKPTALHNMPRSSAVMDLVRAFEQAGVKMQWQGNVLVLEGKSSPDYYNKAIFVGDDLLTFYLFVFLGVASPGKLRFTGGPTLKDTDLSWLAHFMPTLGARMAWTVPGTKGLPVTLECSAVLPAEFAIPGDFPLEASMALLLGGLASKHKVSISLAELPQRDQAQLLELARRVFKYLPGLGQALERSIDFNGYAVSDIDFPSSFTIPLDPALSAYILALPVFSAGRVSLTGRWTNLYQFDELNKLFSVFGLDIKTAENAISSSMQSDSIWPGSLELGSLSPELHPLFWVLNARLCHKAKAAIKIKTYPAGADLEQAADFFEQAGFRLEKCEGALSLSPLSAEDFKLSASRSYGWPCPGAMWGLALSLAAYMRSNLKISNPDCVNQVLPSYWKFYNKLPFAKLRFVEESNVSSANSESAEAPSTRRRIRTNTVIEPELPEAGEADENGLGE